MYLTQLISPKFKIDRYVIVVLFLLSANEVAERQCFYTCLSVILFTGRGVHPPRQTPHWQTPPGRHPLADTPWQTPPGRHPDTPLADRPSLADTPWQTPPSPRQPLQRTVSILLECILVLKRKTSSSTYTASVLFVGNLRSLWPKEKNSKQMSFVFKYQQGI